MQQRLGAWTLELEPTVSDPASSLFSQVTCWVGQAICARFTRCGPEGAALKDYGKTQARERAQDVRPARSSAGPAPPGPHGPRVTEVFAGLFHL